MFVEDYVLYISLAGVMVGFGGEEGGDRQKDHKSLL
jgi:hypothetical protein